MNINPQVAALFQQDELDMFKKDPSHLPELFETCEKGKFYTINGDRGSFDMYEMSKQEFDELKDVEEVEVDSDFVMFDDANMYIHIQ